MEQERVVSSSTLEQESFTVEQPELQFPLDEEVPMELESGTSSQYQASCEDSRLQESEWESVDDSARMYTTSEIASLVDEVERRIAAGNAMVDSSYTTALELCSSGSTFHSSGGDRTYARNVFLAKMGTSWRREENNRSWSDESDDETTSTGNKCQFMSLHFEGTGRGMTFESPMSPPGHERGETDMVVVVSDDEDSVQYMDATTKGDCLPDEAAHNHVTQDFGATPGCMICGKSIEEMLETLASQYMDLTNVPEETVDVRAARRRGFLDGLCNSAVFPVPRGVSQVATCDGNRYQVTHEMSEDGTRRLNLNLNPEI